MMEFLIIVEYFVYGGTRFYETDKVILTKNDGVYLISGRSVTELIESDQLIHEIKRRAKQIRVK